MFVFILLSATTLKKTESVALTNVRGYSSVVEHLTADQEVLSSNLGAPSLLFALHLYYINICRYT